MKLDEAEAILKEMEGDAKSSRSRELREEVQKTIEVYRAIIKDLRKLYH